MRQTGEPVRRPTAKRVPVESLPPYWQSDAYTNEPIRLLFNEFRWQRRMMLGLILLLFFSLPSVMWWMQTSSKSGYTTPSATTYQTTTNSTDQTSKISQTVPVTSPATVTCGNGKCVSLQTTTPVTETGAIAISGNLRASNLLGNGAGLRNVDAVTLSGQPLSYFSDASHLTAGSFNPALLASIVAALPSSTTGNTLPLPITSGGTATTFLPAGQLLVGSGIGPVTTIASGTSGQCLLQPISGTIGFADCPTGTLQAGFLQDTGSSDIITVPTRPTFTIQDGSGTAGGTPLLQLKNKNDTIVFTAASDGNLTLGGGQSAGRLTIQGSPSGTNPLTVLQANSNQTADALAIRSVNGTTVAKIDTDGNAVFRSVSQTTGTSSFADLSLSGNASLLGSVGIGTSQSIGARLQVAALPTQVGLLVRAGSQTSNPT